MFPLPEWLPMPDTNAQDVDGVITKVSPHSVADTIARLTALVTEKNMKVFAVIDHSGEARNAGLDLRDTKVVIFGSPVVDRLSG